MVDVIPSPELHAADPSDGVLRKTSVNPGLVSEKFRSAVFVEVTVAEHGGVGVEVTLTGSFDSHAHRGDIRHASA